jgi:hypothetical protein
MNDNRRHAPATLRNRDPIVGVLRQVLPGAGTVLELASGSGEHIVHFAEAFPSLRWQPSDPDDDARASIAAWSGDHALENILPPLAIDASDDDWPLDEADAMICINMIHISPWTATEGLMQGAGRLLRAGAPLYLYGPFRRSDRPLEPSNAAFDADLRRRNPRWGLRLLDEVIDSAGTHGLVLERTVDMPANNLSIILRKV